MHLKKRWFDSLPVVVVAVVLAALPAAAWPAVEGSFQRTLTVTGPVDLQVTTGSGDITVRAGASGKIEVHGVIRASSSWSLSREEAEGKVKAIQANPPIEQTGNTIRIGHFEDRDLHRNVSISYEITVPADTTLKSETGSGEQTVDGLNGRVKAGTGSGTIHLAHLGDEVEASSGSGDIEVDSCKGSLRVSTGSGSVRAHDVAGSFRARTGSGDVRSDSVGPGLVDVSTGSGSIEVHGVQGSLSARTGSGDIAAQGEMTGDWNMGTGSGDISVQLPPDAGFEFYAHTSSGSISSRHPVTMQGVLGGKKLEGKVGNGGPRLEVKTSSGDISID